MTVELSALQERADADLKSAKSEEELQAVRTRYQIGRASCRERV